jgi:hypothetical protein
MLSSNVTWQNLTNLNQIAPTALTDGLKSLSGILESADSVLNFVIEVLEFIEQFIISPGDLIANFFKSLVANTITALTDSLSLGGGFIVVHPWNRTNKRYINKSTNPLFPLNIPAMNVQEALNEFYASFTNTRDPYRPQWTDNTQVTGIGLLLIGPDPTSFLNLASAIGSIFSIKEFTEVRDKFAKDISTWASNTKIQTGTLANNLTSFDLTQVTNLNFRGVVGVQNGQEITLNQVLAGDAPIPDLHWYGLTLSNIPFLNTIVEAMGYMIDKLVDLISFGTNIIASFINVLISKIRALQDLVRIILNACASFLISLQSTDLYFFSVAPNYGGVNYIIQSIKDSISSPIGDGALVSKHLTDSNFSLLFFAGAGYGVNLTAWNNMFKNSFDQTTAAAQALAQLSVINFAVIPNFEGKVFVYGEPITMRVTSQDSTINHPLYYTYSIKDSTGLVVASFTNKVIGGNTLKVNIDTVTLNVRPAVEPLLRSMIGIFTISIDVFDFISINSNYTATFTITDLLSSITTTLSDTGAVDMIPTQDGKVSISSNGITMEESRVSAGNTLSMGSLVPPFTDNVNYLFIGKDGTSFTTNLVNNKGYRVANIDSLPIPNSFRFLSFPGKICFNFEGALKIRQVGITKWTYMTLPACMTIQGLGCYEYYIYTPASGWGGPFTFCIVDQTNEGTQVC